MFKLSYADAQNHILIKGGFVSEASALNWIKENEGTITPFKLLKNDPAFPGCPVTVIDFKNYTPGKYTATYFIN